VSDETLNIAAFPQPPEGSTFRLRECKKIAVPHPYVIGAGHVGIASDKFGGRLGIPAIEAAERKGIGCQWRGCQLSHKEHTNDLTLFIEVESNSNLNSIPGLHAYLVSIKAQAEALGVKGFAFPKVGQKT
jgi:hypothetical protein